MCLKITKLTQISSIDSVFYLQLIRSIFYMYLMLITLQLFTAVVLLSIEFHISKYPCGVRELQNLKDQEYSNLSNKNGA